MLRKSLTIQLDALIEGGRVCLTYGGSDDRRDVTRLDDVAGSDEVEAVTLEVRDFVHDGTLYDVYGVVLDRDRRSVVEHWQKLERGNGVRRTFRVSGDEPFLVGAVPRNPGVPAPRPAPAAHDGGSPISPKPRPRDPK